MTDEELLTLYQNRWEEAIQATQEKYGSYCRAIAQRILSEPEDAEECLSDVWLKVWNAIPPERPAYFKGWLGAVTRNQALTICRTHSRRPCQVEDASLELAQALAGGPEENLEAIELGRAISAFLGKQKPADRTAFLRRYWYGNTVEETARCMGWSVSRTKSSLFRMRKKLKDHLEKEELYHE